jgi:hypothetical protein
MIIFKQGTRESSPSRLASRLRAGRTTIPALAVSLLLNWPASLMAQSDAVEIDVNELASSIEALELRLKQVRSAIDRSKFEPDAVVDKLDYEADQLVAFAGSNIVFQAYEGALRGPVGALRARAGNSLDQAILLAYMLKSAGFDARVARGTLSDSEALRLLGQTRNPPPAESLAYLEPALAAIRPQAGPTSTAPTQWPETELFRKTERLVTHLNDSLAAKGLELRPGDAAARWMPVVKTYFWVEHRDGPSEAWQAAHPAFGQEPPPAELEAQEYFAASIPEKYHQTLTISAWIEQWKAGSLQKYRVMDDWSAPTANLNGKPLQFRNAPNGLTIETASRMDEAIANSTMLTPMFNGTIAPGAKVFDLQGRTVDPFALSQGSAGLFQTLGDKLASASGEVMDPVSGQPILALHSMYLEFTHTSPSGQSDVRRRYILPPRQDYSDDSKDVLWRLITDHVYMVATGSEPVDFVADRYFNTAIESMDWLIATVRKAFHPEQEIVVPDELPSDLPPLAQYWLMDLRPTVEKDVIAYRATPGLIGIRRGFRNASTAFAAVDVVWNRVEHLRRTADGLQSLPQSAVSSGVWDTALESVPGRALHTEDVTVSSTIRVFDLAAEQGIDTIVLSPGETKPLDDMQLGAVATQFLRDDLARGYAIVIPERVPKGAPTAGWWRVHAESGETLGMTGDGYGAEVVEYMMDMIGIAKGLVDALQSIVKCDEKTDNVQKMCCLVEAHINNVAGLGFGGLLGSVFGTVGATMFDIANTATQAATGGQGLMPSANLKCDEMQGTAW